MKRKSKFEGMKQIAFRMTEEDYITIKEKALKEGMSVNKYVVDTLIENDMKSMLKIMYNTSVYTNLEKIAKENNKTIEDFLTQFNIKTKEKARELNMPLDKYIDFVITSSISGVSDNCKEV